MVIGSNQGMIYIYIYVYFFLPFFFTLVFFLFSMCMYGVINKLFRYMKKYLLDVGSRRGSRSKSINVTGIEDEHIKDVASQTEG